MIDLAKYSDDIILSTREVCEWTTRAKSAILGSRIPPVQMTGRENHYRAADVKRWVIKGNAAFEAPAAAPASVRPLKLTRQG